MTTTRQVTTEERREIALLALRQHFGSPAPEGKTGTSLGDRAEEVMDTFSRIACDRFGGGTRVSFADPALIWNLDQLIQSGRVEDPVL